MYQTGNKNNLKYFRLWELIFQLKAKLKTYLQVETQDIP